MASEAMTTEVAIRQETSAVMMTNAQLQMIANTSFVPKEFRGKVPEVLACVATGRALGLPDMTSLRGIHVIEGKATLSAELMVAIVRGHGHSITGSCDRERAEVRGKRGDNGDTMSAVFDRQMAEDAGLLGKSNWKKHPDDMMWARAVSKLCRRLFADCFAGATYVPEEMEPTGDELLDEEEALGEPEDAGGRDATVGAGSSPETGSGSPSDPEASAENGTTKHSGSLTDGELLAQLLAWADHVGEAEPKKGEGQKAYALQHAGSRTKLLEARTIAVERAGGEREFLEAIGLQEAA